MSLIGAPLGSEKHHCPRGPYEVTVITNRVEHKKLVSIEKEENYFLLQNWLIIINAIYHLDDLRENWNV